MADSSASPLLTEAEVKALVASGKIDKYMDVLTPPEKAMVLKASIAHEQSTGGIKDDAGGLAMLPSGGKSLASTTPVSAIGNVGVDALNYVKAKTPAILKHPFVQGAAMMGGSQLLPPGQTRNLMEMLGMMRGAGGMGGGAGAGEGAMTEEAAAARNASQPAPMERKFPVGQTSPDATFPPNVSKVPIPPEAPALGINVAPETSQGLDKLKQTLSPMPPERGGTMHDIFERVNGGGMSAEGKGIATSPNRGPAPALDPRSDPGDFESLMKGDTKKVKLKSRKKPE